ncbi:Metabotropic GABA-B receptor subtype 3A [Allomyces arbusculus]|nr:Metabotropic GABA-B receptor subtype 3A [Allomyces arbusculus]
MQRQWPRNPCITAPPSRPHPPPLCIGGHRPQAGYLIGRTMALRTADTSRRPSRRAHHDRFNAMLAIFLFMFAAATLAAATPVNFAIALQLPNTTTLYPVLEGIYKSVPLVERYVNTLNPNFTFTILNTPTTSGTESTVDTTLSNYLDDNVLGIVGMLYSRQAIPAALISRRFHGWMCSGTATSVALSDNTLYPTFFRTVPDDPQQGRAIALFVHNMGWSVIASFVCSDQYGLSVRSGLLAATPALGISLLEDQQFPAGTTDVRDQLTKIRDCGSRIIIVAGVPDELTVVFIQAAALGMIGTDWVWIGGDGLAVMAQASTAIPGFDPSLMNGIFSIVPIQFAQTRAFEVFRSDWNATYPNQAIPEFGTGPYIDCMVGMAHGLIRIANEFGAATILSRSYNATQSDFLPSFVGISGNITFDATGNRQADFHVYNVYDSVPHIAFEVGPTQFTTLQPPRFYSGTSEVPLDRPVRQRLDPVLTHPATAVVFALNVAAMAAILVTTAYLVRQRRLAVVRAMSFPFLLLTAVGCLLVHASNLVVLNGPPTDASCMASTFTFMYGFQIIATASGAKAYRLYTVFENQRLARTSISTRMLLAGVAVLAAGETILAIVWASIAPPTVVTETTPYFVVSRCSGTDPGSTRAMTIATLGYNGILLCLVVYLAFKTRHVMSAYKESSWLFMTAQNSALCALIVVILAQYPFTAAARTVTLVSTATVTYGNAFAFLALVGRVVVLARRVQVAQKVAAKESAAAARKEGAVNAGLSAAAARRYRASGGNVLDTVSAKSGANGSGVEQEHVMEVTWDAGGKTVILVESSLPVKRGSYLFSTWQQCTVTADLEHGTLTMFPTRHQPARAIGTAIALASITVTPHSGVAANCLDVTVSADATWIVQFANDEDRDQWTAMVFPDQAVATPASGSSVMHRLKRKTRRPAAATALAVSERAEPSHTTFHDRHWVGSRLDTGDGSGEVRAAALDHVSEKSTSGATEKSSVVSRPQVGRGGGSGA